MLLMLCMFSPLEVMHVDLYNLLCIILNQLNKLTFMDSFGFDQMQIKQLLITNPKLYTAG